MKRSNIFKGIAVTFVAALALTGCSQAASTDVPDTSNVTAEGPAALVPADVAERGTLIVASTAATPPEGFKQDDGSLAGYEISILESIGEILGLKVEWQVTDFASLIPGLQSARFDAAVGQVGVTAERAEVVDFVTLIQANQAFAAATTAGLKDITIDDLCGRSVATLQGSRQQQFGDEQSAKCVDEGKPAIDMNMFQNPNDAWLALQSGRAEIYWSGATNVGYMVSTSEGTEIVGTHLQTYPSGIVLAKDSPLGLAIEAAEQQMIDDGSYQAILDEWGISANAIDAAELNPEITW